MIGEGEAKRSFIRAPSGFSHPTSCLGHGWSCRPAPLKLSLALRKKRKPTFRISHVQCFSSRKCVALFSQHHAICSPPIKIPVGGKSELRATQNFEPSHVYFSSVNDGIILPCGHCRFVLFSTGPPPITITTTRANTVCISLVPQRVIPFHSFGRFNLEGEA